MTRSDRGDGLDLRGLRCDGEEVSARLYFAVRDEWWRTVPLRIVGRRHETTTTGWLTAVDAVGGGDHPVDVSLRYTADGPELRAEVTAVARGAFAYRRIGLCLLLSDALAGRPATSWRSGVATEFGFPTPIVTRDWLDDEAVRFHQPFDALATTLPSGRAVRYVFEGEDFEFEDQRNWTDASYKAYSIRPPGPWPLTTVDGDWFEQRIRISAGNPAPGPGSFLDDRAIRLGERIGDLPPVQLFEGRVSPHSYRPGGGFQELNANQPSTNGCDSIELAVNGAVHAADDDSVMETTALHGAIIEQTRATYPGRPVRLAPVSFLDAAGDWRDDAGLYTAEPPPGPLPARLLGEFAATWAIASAAHAVPARPDLLCYFDAKLPADSPASRTVSRLWELCGRPVLAVTAPAPVAALAIEVDGMVALAVANPSPDPVRFQLPDGAGVTLPGFASAWYEQPGPAPRSH